MIDISNSTNEHLQNIEVARLVSFPRTGSHWLRIMVELYIGVPCAPQKFFADSSNEDIWAFHVHNRRVYNPHHSEGPCFKLKKVLYLHRDPIDTIYSQLKYDKIIPLNWTGSVEKENIDIKKEMYNLIYEYRNHLFRWRFFKEDIESYTEITYEDLKENTFESLKKVINFIDEGITINDKLLKEVIAASNKSITKRVTPHDVLALNDEIINNPQGYNSSRTVFKEMYGATIEKYFVGLRG